MSGWLPFVACVIGLAGGASITAMVMSSGARQRFDRRCAIVNALRGGRQLTEREICEKIGRKPGTIDADLTALACGHLIAADLDTRTPADRFLYRLTSMAEVARG
jgi:hypothetical protein